MNQEIRNGSLPLFLIPYDCLSGPSCLLLLLSARFSSVSSSFMSPLRVTMLEVLPHPPHRSPFFSLLFIIIEPAGDGRKNETSQKEEGRKLKKKEGKIGRRKMQIVVSTKKEAKICL